VEPLLILDDLAARKAAEQFGFPIIGTLGILEEAKLQGVLKEIRPILDELKQVNFRVSKVLETVLK
jgi:predicted nucleic acid-binding protein